MRYIPIVKCSVCPYVRQHELTDNNYMCRSIKDTDLRDITFAVMNDLVSSDCPLPEAEFNKGDKEDAE